MFQSAYVLNKKLDVKFGGVSKLVTVPFLFSPKSLPYEGWTNSLENANLVKTNVANISREDNVLGLPEPTATGIGTELSLSEYSQMAFEDNDAYYWRTKDISRNTPYIILKFSLIKTAQKYGAYTGNDTLLDLIKNTFKFFINIKAFGFGSNGGVESFGINVDMYNFKNSIWDLKTSNAANSFDDEMVLKLNLDPPERILQYLNNDGELYICLSSKYPTDGKIISGIKLNCANAEMVVESIQLPVATRVLGSNDHVSLEINATNVESASSFNVEIINVLINDGNDDIYFNFDKSIEKEGTITLKPSESLSDFPRNCKQLYYKSKSGIQPFRAWGVR